MTSLFEASGDARTFERIDFGEVIGLNVTEVRKNAAARLGSKCMSGISSKKKEWKDVIAGEYVIFTPAAETRHTTFFSKHMQVVGFHMPFGSGARQIIRGIFFDVKAGKLVEVVNVVPHLRQLAPSSSHLQADAVILGEAVNEWWPRAFRKVLNASYDFFQVCHAKMLTLQ
jgi:hypothetical protein